MLRATELFVPWQGRQPWRELAERALTNCEQFLSNGRREFAALGVVLRRWLTVMLLLMTL